MEYQEPTESDKEIVNFVVNHCDRWRDWRDVNCLDDWLEYERIFNGEWDVQDKTRESERSRIVTPATQQAVETRHAEIMPKHDEDKGDIGEKKIGGQLGLVRINSTQRLIKKHT